MKKIFFFFLFATLCCKTFAQVHLQTGSATFNLPLFDWKDDKSRLNSTVSLNYNSGNGLKVGEVASNIGQGWSLIAGGVITRMQVGEPDDQKAYTTGGNEAVDDINKYPDGYLNNYTNLPKGCPTALTKYPIFGSRNKVYKQNNKVAADREQDYFSFSFNGRSGMFVLGNPDPNYIGIDHVLLLGDSKLKISFNRNNPIANCRTTITDFTIQDENGLTYRFATVEKTKIFKSGYCDADLKEYLTQPEFENAHVYHESDFDKVTVNPYIINSWYLTEIEDPLTHRKITFTYTIRTINTLSGISVANNQGTDKNYVIISHKFSQTQTPAIATINYPDGHQVAFNYGTPRMDMQGDLVLSSIDVKYTDAKDIAPATRYLSKYVLNSSYFILNRHGTPLTDFQKSVARLCLMSVQKYGVDLKSSDNPYLFDYYTGSSTGDDVVPPPFSVSKDPWGYYNGDYSRDINNNPVDIKKPLNQLSFDELRGLCFLRNNSGTVSPSFNNAKSGYAKNGLLKQIIYPTGGTLTYKYEQNTGIMDGQTMNIGGVHVSETDATDGGYSNGCGNPLVTKYNYVLPNTAQSSLWGIESPLNNVKTYSHYEAEYKYYYYKFPFGQCSYHYQYPGILSREDQISLSPWNRFMENAQPFLNVLNTITGVLDVVKVCLGSTGFLAWSAVVVDIVGGLLDIILTCFNNTAKDYETTIYYNSDLNSLNPLPMQFKRVEVVSGTGGVGKTVQTFTSEDFYSIWEPQNLYFSRKQRFAYWAYGLPLLTTIYDVNGKKVSETENFYDTTFARYYYYLSGKLGVYDGSCYKCQVLKTFSQRNTDWQNPAFYDDPTSYKTKSTADLGIEEYKVSTGRIALDSTVERTFKLNDPSQFVKKKTSYTYNNNYQIYSAETLQSNGDQIDKYYTYSGDGGAGTLSTLKENNILSIPVTTKSSVYRSDGTTGDLHETSTSFVALSNGDIKPSAVYERRSDKPWDYSSVPALKQIQSFTYNGTSGNLIGMSDEGSHTLTNIYDYNDKYIIASVINADPVVDKPAYTSFETKNLGGWSLTGTPGTYSSNNTITGTHSFTLSASGSLTASINTAKSYILTFWSTGSVTISSNGGLIKSGPAINGLTYYEYAITPGAASVSISGTSTIDELRLYPKAARMRSVSYDPLVGKTSECDENNRITYYEYDDLGRLFIVRDENRNIVKVYEYNTITKQNGCPGTYSNKAISETFTTSCASNQIGKSVTYTVPANKYTSTISQTDADRQAEDEINTLGQAFANNSANGGGCIQLFYNDAKSQSFTKEDCATGYKGTTITYIVPVNKYSALTKAEANRLRDVEIAANGQAFANAPGNAACVIDNTADWEADNPQLRCQKDSYGSFTGHQEGLLTDINPNSSTYNQTAWKDVGFNESSCPHTVNSAPSLNGSGYLSVTKSGVKTGNPGTTVTVNVTLNSSNSTGNLTGSVGSNAVQLSGTGNKTSTFSIVIPETGYISWTLTLSGNIGPTGDYISSNISFTP